MDSDPIASACGLKKMNGNRLTSELVGPLTRSNGLRISCGSEAISSSVLPEGFNPHFSLPGMARTSYLWVLARIDQSQICGLSAIHFMQPEISWRSTA